MSEWTNSIVGRDGHLQICHERTGCWMGEAACCDPLPPRRTSHLVKERRGECSGLGRGEEVEGSKRGDIIAVFLIVLLIVIDVVVVVAIIVVIAITMLARWKLEGWAATLHLRGTARVGCLSSTAKTTLSSSLVIFLDFSLIFFGFICKMSDG